MSITARRRANSSRDSSPCARRLWTSLYVLCTVHIIAKIEEEEVLQKRKKIVVQYSDV
jgi:hypothetical protein